MKLFKRDHYEKLMADNPKTVQDYQLQILRAEEKIKELQSKCDHPDYEAVMYSWRVGSYQPSHICKSCNVYLGEATPEESDKLWKALHGTR